MDTTIRNIMNEYPRLAQALTWNATDPSLSSSQRALAAITECLSREFDALDGTQQRALVDALEKQTTSTEQAENYVRNLLQQ